MASHSKRLPRLVFALGVLIVALHPAHAQDGYPSRPIRLIVPTGPGGSTDLSARLLARGLSKSLGQQVVVENRPGAAAMIGSDIVAKAAPDGYTLLATPPTLAINPATYKKMPYDALRDFAPITQILSVPLTIFIHPSLPATSVREFIAFAKAHPGEIMYGSPGYGSHPHMTIELFAYMAHIRMLHIPYSHGSGAVLVDLLAGRVQLMATNLVLTIPYMRAGKLRVLGVTTAIRSPALPEVPTIAEAGLPGYESVFWSGLVAPAGTPREIISRLHKESIAILRAPEAAELLATLGAEMVASSPEEFSGFIKVETLKWARVAKAAGIQPQ